MDSKTGWWYCHSACGRGGDLVALEMALTGSDFLGAKQAIFDLLGRPVDHRMDRVDRYQPAVRQSAQRKPRPEPKSDAPQPKMAVAAIYEYQEANGALRYQIVRFEPEDPEQRYRTDANGTKRKVKEFRQRYPDGRGGWIWRKHARQVLYHLPELLEAPIVFVVVGERDADTLRDWGFIATTNAGGAKAAWLPEFTEALAGKEVVIIPDNDRDGYSRGVRIARELRCRASRVAVVMLDDSRAKDITEWFELAHSELELISQVEKN
jgi:hypothetical protein